MPEPKSKENLRSVSARTAVLVAAILTIFSEEALADGVSRGLGGLAEFLWGAYAVLGVVPIGCALAAIVLKWRRKCGRDWTIELIVPTALYVGIVVCAAPVQAFFGILNPWVAPAHMTWVFPECFFLLTVWTCLLLKGRRARAVAACIAVAVLVLETLLTPGIVSFRYVTTIDNDPLVDPVETLASDDPHFLRLKDGRVLRFERRIGYFRDGRKVMIWEQSLPGKEKRYLLFVKDANPAYGEAIRQVRGRFRIPLKEVRAEKNKAVLRGEGWLAGTDWDATGEMLYRATLRRSCRVEWIKTLLRNGADPNYVFPPTGTTPLMIAADWRERTEVVEVLLAAGADVSRADKRGMTALHRSASTSSRITRRLLEAGADPFAKDEKGRKPIDIARHCEANGLGTVSELPEVIRVLEKAKPPPKP